MASHNTVNGVPCHSSKWLLTHVFRTELGCDKCLIATDFRDIELLDNMNTANDTRYPGMPADTDASIQSLAAGMDQDLGEAIALFLSPAPPPFPPSIFFSPPSPLQKKNEEKKVRVVLTLI